MSAVIQKLKQFLKLIRGKKTERLQMDVREECLKNRNFILELEMIAEERRNIMKELEELFL